MEKTEAFAILVVVHPHTLIIPAGNKLDPVRNHRSVRGAGGSNFFQSQIGVQPVPLCIS